MMSKIILDTVNPTNWVKWEGGECPVTQGTLIDIVYRDDHVQLGVPAGDAYHKAGRSARTWFHNDVPGDIMFYRLTDVRNVTGGPVCMTCGDTIVGHHECETPDPKTNPKQGTGAKKFSMSRVPACVLGELAVAMTEGAWKHGFFNFRISKMLATTYYDATQRHLLAWYDGEDIDPDSGLSHITKAIASLVVLRDSMINGTFKDNRPKKAPATWVNGVNALTEVLADKYGV